MEDYVKIRRNFFFFVFSELPNYKFSRTMKSFIFYCFVRSLMLHSLKLALKDFGSMFNKTMHI